VFSDCTSLTNVTIGTGVTSLGSNAFSACISLTVIHFQGNAPSLAGAVFANDNNAIVYYQPGTTGWGSTFGGLPTAIWGQFRAVVTVAANPAQGGTVTGGGVLAVGTNVPISASANSGWTFTGWSDGGNQSHSITVPATNTTYTANFTQNPTVAPPTIAPAGGTFTNTVTVTLACSTAGATIRYTTDSSDPTASSPVYTKAFAVTSTGTIKAKAFKTGDADSAIAAGAFTIINTTPTVATPAITPAGGTFSNLVKVTLSCPTAGATIRYTTNGTDPTSKSPAYVKTAITVTNSVTFKAIAFKTKLANSAVATAPFTIIPPPPVTITTTSLPAGIIKVKYAGAILHATGGTTPDKWSWVAQTGSKLPPGLTLNATTGAIAGKPTKAGTYNITVKATDAKKQTATQLLSVIITAS